MAKRSMAEEIKQTRPFRSRSQEALLSILRTAHLLRRQIDAFVAPEGITGQQYNVLRILRGARGPLPTMEISDRMIETSCGITRLITTLEEKGLIRREQWPGDRRHFLCQITPAGLRLLERLDAGADAFDDAVTGGIDPASVQSLIETLTEIREHLSEEEAELPAVRRARGAPPR